MQMGQKNVPDGSWIHVCCHNLVGCTVTTIEEVMLVTYGDQNTGIVTVRIRHGGTGAQHDYSHNY